MEPVTTLYSMAVKAGDITDKMLKALGFTKGKLEDMLTKTSDDSLTKQVSGAVSVFPVIFTADIPEQAAGLITQMLEIEYANYMTLALANSPKINVNDVNDAKYLKRYHTNLNQLESVENVLSESFDENDEIESSLARSLVESVIGANVSVSKANRNMLRTRMNEAMTPENKFYGLAWLMEGNHSQENKYREARENAFKNSTPDNEKKETAYRKDLLDSFDREHNRKRELGNDIFNAGKNISSETRNWMKYSDDKKEQERRNQREEEQTTDSHVARNFDKTYTIKKLNEMQPTPVVAHIFTVDNNNTPSRQIDIVCGVKAKAHQINKREFISLMKSEDPGNLITDIIRFTTGEKHFFSDILLGNNSIKEYAAKSGRFSSNGAKILATLKRVKDLNRKGSSLKPNATLVVSKSAVDELKRVHGIDLLDEDDASSICDNLSLIKLIISDPIAGKLHTLMPGYHDRFSTTSTDTLEKQVDATQDAALTKELRKIVSKGA